MGPGPDDDGEESTSRPRNPRTSPRIRAPRAGGSAVLASARELLDAAEAWRGRPVVPA